MTKATNTDINKVFWEHTKRYPWLLFWLLFSVFLSQGVGLATPWFLKQLADAVVSLPTHSITSLTKLSNIVYIILALEIASFVGNRLQGIISTVMQPKVMSDLSNSAFQKTLGHSYAFFANTFAGSLVRKINRLSRSYEDIMDQVQYNVLPLIISTIGITIAISFRSRLIAIFIIIWFVIFVLTQYWFSKWKRPYEIAKTEADSNATGVLSDAITNSGTIRLFTGQRYERKRFSDIIEYWRAATVKTWMLNEYGYAVQSAAMTILELSSLLFAVHLWNEGMLTVGDFVLLQTYLWSLIEKSWGVGRIFRQFSNAYADASEIVEIMNEPYGIRDKANAKPLIVRQGNIHFDTVDFSFHQTRKVLNAFTLDIKPGERVALVGSSGAGKTTITNLLFRLYDVDRGHILIDGQDIAQVTQESLHNAIGLVPQEPILFHRTLKENIRYGRRNATDEEVIEAAKRARCHEFIMELPQGYDTYVGERGVKLSGGERQRVAIARAILKNAPILVLDEATSSLDSESESLIQAALKELMQSKTVIVIAHRLSTIMEMDRIVVIEDGRVVDTGTHDELLAREGVYKKLWQIQAGGFLPDDQIES